MKLKSLLTYTWILTLLTGVVSAGEQTKPYMLSPEEIRADKTLNYDSVIPADPEDLYERGVVRSLYAVAKPEIPTKEKINKEEVVLKYGIPYSYYKKHKKDYYKDVVVEKYAVPVPDEKSVIKNDKNEKELFMQKDEQVLKYAPYPLENSNK